MLKTVWNTVMSADQNPLLNLPKTLRFQLMTVLAFMWSVIFCISAGLVTWLPEFVLGHVILLLFGIFFTGFVFRVHRV